MQGRCSQDLMLAKRQNILVSTKKLTRFSRTITAVGDAGEVLPGSLAERLGKFVAPSSKACRMTCSARGRREDENIWGMEAKIEKNTSSLQQGN
jgi:hypothetical protein